MYEIANEADRYKLKNSAKPTKSSISEPDQAEMEEFIDNLRLLVNTLGHKIFDSIAKDDSSDNETIFEINKRNRIAKGKPTSEGFVVLKNSEISNSLGAVNSTIVKLREKLVLDGIIAEEDNQAIVTKDYVFSSPSLAATIVMGISANGRKEWRHNGKTLKDFE